MPRLPIPGVKGRPVLSTKSLPVGPHGIGSSLANNGHDSGQQQQQMGRTGGLGQSFAPLRPNQQQVLGNLNRVREMVMAEMSRLDQQRVNEFLNACSEGNEYRIKKVSCPGGGV